MMRKEPYEQIGNVAISVDTEETVLLTFNKSIKNYSIIMIAFTYYGDLGYSYGYTLIPVKAWSNFRDLRFFILDGQNGIIKFATVSKIDNTSCNVFHPAGIGGCNFCSAFGIG